MLLFALLSFDEIQRGYIPPLPTWSLAYYQFSKGAMGLMPVRFLHPTFLSSSDCAEYIPGRAPDAPHRILGLPLHATVVKDVVELESKGKMDICLECPKKKISMRLRCLDKSIKNHWLKEIRKAVQMPNKASISQFEVQTRELESSSAGVAISKDLISFD